MVVKLEKVLLSTQQEIWISEAKQVVAKYLRCTVLNFTEQTFLSVNKQSMGTQAGDGRLGRLQCNALTKPILSAEVFNKTRP